MFSHSPQHRGKMSYQTLTERMSCFHSFHTDSNT